MFFVLYCFCFLMFDFLDQPPAFFAGSFYMFVIVLGVFRTYDILPENTWHPP